MGSTAPYIRSGEWDKMEDIQCVLSHNAYLPQSIPDIIYSAENRYHPSYKNPNNKDKKLTIICNDHDDEKKEKESKKKKKKISKKKKKKKKKKEDDDKMIIIGKTVKSQKEKPKPKQIENKKTKKKKNDEIVAPRIGKHGVWVLIGQHVTFRNDVKARERYMNVLNPDIDIESRWTQKEDDDLLKYHNEFGDKWALIARKLGTKRTDCYCRQRCKALMKKSKRAKNKKLGTKSRKQSRKQKDVITIDLAQNSDQSVEVNAATCTPKRRILRAPRTPRKRKRDNQNKEVINDLDISMEPNRKKQKKSNKYAYIPSLHPIIPTIPDLASINDQESDSINDGRMDLNELIGVNQNVENDDCNQFVPEYLETPFHEQMQFIGNKPNRFILNQYLNKIECINDYIVPWPIKESNSDCNGHRMLSMEHDNLINAFIKEQTPKSSMNCIPPSFNHDIPPFDAPIIHQDEFKMPFPSLMNLDNVSNNTTQQRKNMNMDRTIRAVAI